MWTVNWKGCGRKWPWHILWYSSILQGSGIALWYSAGLRAGWSRFESRQPPIQWATESLSLWVKQPGREADLSPPSSAEVKECVELYFHSPNTPSWPGVQLKHRDNFTVRAYLWSGWGKPAKSSKWLASVPRIEPGWCVMRRSPGFRDHRASVSWYSLGFYSKMSFVSYCTGYCVSSVSIVTDLRTGRPEFDSRQGQEYYSVYHRVHFGSGTHPASYEMDTRDSGDKMAGAWSRPLISI
jgi:hypothetical protein